MSINKPSIYKIALLISIACVLQIFESMIPHPIPGLRLGLSNMVTLVSLVMLNFIAAMEIAVLRTILSSIIMGTFMSPAFILSFVSAVISTIVMGLLMQYCKTCAPYKPSIIGISIIGALIHNIVQLYLAYLILIRHGGIFVFLPWLCLGSIAMGWITGVVAGSVCQKLEECSQEKPSANTLQKDADGIRSYHYCEGSSFIHRLSPEFKISAMIFLSLFILAVHDYKIFMSLFLFIALIVICSKVSPVYLFSRVYGFGTMILIAFLLPLFFNQDTHILFKISRFAVTHEGLTAGSIISARIIFLILISAIVIRTTSPSELTTGLAKVLIPLRYIGISENRTANILLLSWTFLPAIWDIVRNEIKNANFSKAKNLRNLIPLLSGLITNLYLETEQQDKFLYTCFEDKKEKKL